MRIERGALLLAVAVACSGVAVYSMQTASAGTQATSCTNGDGRGWGTGYDDMRVQCFDTRSHGGPDILWCVTGYGNGVRSPSCQWASAARR